MFEKIELDPNAYINVLVTDFIARARSVNISLNAPLDRFALPRYDIHVVIGAPDSCCALKMEGEHVFFVEPCQKARQLGESHYQIVHEGTQPDKTGFLQWAYAIVEFFKRMQFNIGMVCVDYSDFRTALDSCNGKVLRFEQLPYDIHDAVPYHKHSGADYRVIYGCICSTNELSLGHYTDFTETVEVRNPNLAMSKLAVTLGGCFPPVMMLLGEAATSSTE